MRIDKLASTVNTTKLAPPGKHSGLLVDRTELCARIAKRATRRLTTLVAPAGYGKTSLLTQVRHEIERSAAATGWLSVDEEDNDLGRFLLHLVDTAPVEGALMLQRLHAVWAKQHPGTTFSTGSSSCLADGPGPALEAADRALYRAKEGGRDRDEFLDAQAPAPAPPPPPPPRRPGGSRLRG